jgi:spermidine/putrescine transport system permease protein
VIADKLKKIYIALVVLFLYAPILVLIVLSFNASKSRAKWGGFTFDWYVKLLANDDIMEALYTTLLIAFFSALLASVFGLLLALGLAKLRRGARGGVTALINIPLLNAEIVTGISMMMLFLAIRFQTGFATVLIAHITFNIPYCLLSISPRLRKTGHTTYEAALDLGAKPISAFFKVVFPDILPGIVSGFVLAFTMSLDDFIITFFTRGPSVQTLSTKIYSMQKRGVTPDIYALSTIMFVTVFVLLAIINTRGKGKGVGNRE